MLGHGADAVAWINHNATPLHLATVNGRVEAAIGVLPEHGAHVGAEGDNGVIQIQIATGDEEIIKLLSERGAEGMLKHNPYRASSLGSL